MKISVVGVRAAGACGVVVALGSLAGAQVLTFTEVSEETGIVIDQANAPGMLQSYAIAGGAVGDFNNDGWQDLFVMAGGLEPDRLYINNADGTFTDLAAAWGVAKTHYGVSATCADFNNDGWMDISVSSQGPSDAAPAQGKNILYRNNGNGTFTDIAESAGVAFRVAAADSFATAFGDYDNDGDLDMFSTAYTLVRQGNRLFRNNGDETFTDVTAPSGLEAMIPLQASGFVPAFADMNADGHLDLMLVADHGTSMMFRGNGNGTFTNVTSSVSRLHTANGMGIAIGDLNKDGLLDWYISSIEVTGLPTSGNLLFMQRPDGGFDEMARISGVNRGGWGWGVLMVDLDHDGVEEIVATKNASGASPSHIFKRTGGMQHADISLACHFLHYDGGRGLVNFDYDNDGDQDLVVFTNGGRLGVWRNDLNGPNTNWLRVRLDTSARPTLAPDGFQSVVRIAAGPARHLQVIDGATNHCSSGEHGAHFGLADATSADWVRVEWRDGTSTTVGPVAANQILDLRAPFHPGDFNDDGLLDMGDVVAFASAFLADSPAADLDGNGLRDLNDLVTFMIWSTAD
jgi:hypothetical protein